jgi:hypothetical protein
MSVYRIRRLIAVGLSAVFLVIAILAQVDWYDSTPVDVEVRGASVEGRLANEALGDLRILPPDYRSEYRRDEFGSGWLDIEGCDTRNIILNRDMKDVVVNDRCQVVSGVLYDPYTNQKIDFVRGNTTSEAVQIDHVVPLANAWVTGAQNMSTQERIAFANDPLELLAVEGKANQQKSSHDASQWLPENQSFVCQYVARQVAIKLRYDLWLTYSEHQAMRKRLQKCPSEVLPY